MAVKTNVFEYAESVFDDLISRADPSMPPDTPAPAPANSGGSNGDNNADASLRETDQIQQLTLNFDKSLKKLAMSSANPSEVMSHPSVGDLAFKLLRYIKASDPKFAKQLVTEAMSGSKGKA